MAARPDGLDARCLEAAASLVSRGEYATVGAVVAAVCTSYGVRSLDQLGGATVQAVPTLALLLHVCAPPLSLLLHLCSLPMALCINQPFDSPAVA